MQSVYITKTPEETIELGKKLAGKLCPGDTVLLYGDLGTGKTHFTKGIAEGFGITQIIKSPTYAYVNQYPIVDPLWLHCGSIVAPVGCLIQSHKAKRGATKRSEEPQSEARSHATKEQVLYHYDLYRFEEGQDVSSIGFEETVEDMNAVNVVEWADRLGGKLPDKYILVGIQGIESKREISIKFVSPTILSEDKIEEYYEEWATPMHVREHCKQVTNVAMQIARAYIENGEIINLELLYPACMLHDVNRVCDFKEIEKDKFEEEITDEKWEKWQACRLEFKGMHHADIASKILKERGFTDTAELIRLHKSVNIVMSPDIYTMLERKIIYYADKRVKHKEIVDLKERFRDGRARYEKFDGVDDKELFRKVEIQTFKLEKELFKEIGLIPEDIV